MSSPSTRDWSLIILLAHIWGATFLLAELALVELSPLWLVLLRVGIAAVVLLVVVRVQGVRVALTPVLMVGFLVMGLLNNVVPFTLIFWSQTTIDSSLAAILNATMPFWTVLVAHVATRDERMTPAKITGILLGVAGVAVMIGPSALAGLGAAVLPQLAILLATFSYALASLFGRRFRGLPPMAVALGQLAASALVMLILVLASEPVPALLALSPMTWAAVLALAMVGTGLAYILYFRILASAGATNLSLVTLLIPVTAVLLGGLVLGERLTLLQFSGMLLILLGLAVIDGRMLARWRRSPVSEVS
jgi:drug/metabolite transporter (DMT)-like permease